MSSKAPPGWRDFVPTWSKVSWWASLGVGHGTGPPELTTERKNRGDQRSGCHPQPHVCFANDRLWVSRARRPPEISEIAAVYVESTRSNGWHTLN